MTHPLEPALREGATALGLGLSDAQIAQLLAYLALIQKWNQVYNLTAVRDPAEMMSHHLLDSLAVIRPLLQQTGGRSLRFLDVGSGAGLPGVVVAICCPGWQVDCADTVAKKAAFVQQVAATLPLSNLRGLHARVESLSGPYDVVASRAFASLSDFVTWSAPALGEGGLWMALKGRQPHDEIAALPATVKVFHVEQLVVPGLGAERCIVWLRRASGVT